VDQGDYGGRKWGGGRQESMQKKQEIKKHMRGVSVIEKKRTLGGVTMSSRPNPRMMGFDLDGACGVCYSCRSEPVPTIGSACHTFPYWSDAPDPLQYQVLDHDDHQYLFHLGLSMCH